VFVGRFRLHFAVNLTLQSSNNNNNSSNKEKRFPCFGRFPLEKSITTFPLEASKQSKQQNNIKIN